MEFKRKSFIALAILSTSVVFANYVSFVDVKSSGGIVVEGLTTEEVDDLILSKFPVGTVTIRMDAVNPSTIYGGTWELINADASMRFGDGSNLSGNTEGKGNLMTVPLVKHSHTRGTMDITGAVGNTVGKGASPVTGAFYKSGSTGKGTFSNHDSVSGTYFQASRNWTGSTSEAGVSNATMDVRGNYIRLNAWKRTI